MTVRYAVYHAPSIETELHRLGRLVLGRSLWDPKAGPSAPKASIYGFHATLVAPFRTLSSKGALLETLNDAASKLKPVRIDKLALAGLPPGFPAIVPLFQPPELSELEASLVTAMNKHRRPPAPGEAARRGLLSARQAQLNQKWGYPFVFEEFRYHLTLGDLCGDQASLEKRLAHLSELFDESLLSQGLTIDKLQLCLQEEASSPFRAVSEVRIGPRLIEEAFLSQGAAGQARAADLAELAKSRGARLGESLGEF
ncbi:MAG: DUF1045 domain-containing protein [Deltaproteobacteria bacterium]|jgi:hypothetical protein|nr:DUF1045 domain-containing protein [Deltaproteobacteria bacterium]